LLEETAEEKEACLGKRKEAWKKRLLKRKVSKGLSSQRYHAMYQWYCSYTSWSMIFDPLYSTISLFISVITANFMLSNTVGCS
jgi:hypothetical protein